MFSALLSLLLLVLSIGWTVTIVRQWQDFGTLTRPLHPKADREEMPRAGKIAIYAFQFIIPMAAIVLMVHACEGEPENKSFDQGIVSQAGPTS